MLKKPCTVIVRVNPSGSSYELPITEKERAELLEGAGITFCIQDSGDDISRQTVMWLENFSWTLSIDVTEYSETQDSSAYLYLGRSETAGYYADPVTFKLVSGGTVFVDFVTHQVTEPVIEMCRVQPYVQAPMYYNTDRNIIEGISYLGCRMLTGTGTKLHLGYYKTKERKTFVPEPKTFCELWNCTKDQIEEKINTARRIISPKEIIDPGAIPEDWKPVEDRLKCLKNMKIGTITFSGDTTTVGGNKIVRYDPIWIKTTFEDINIPYENDKHELVENKIKCFVMWYSDVPMDEEYHLHALFKKHIRKDYEYTTLFCKHGYISRYPISNNQSIYIDGEPKEVPQFKTGGIKNFVPGNREYTLDICKNLNDCTARLYFDDDGDGIDELVEELPPDESKRTFGLAGTAEISFMQWMSCLYLGVNSQGHNYQNEAVFPGVAFDYAYTYKKNGATDYIVEKTTRTPEGKNVFNGSEDTERWIYPMVFLGVENATWSTSGWMIGDLTFVKRRTITTFASGDIQKNEITSSLLTTKDSNDILLGSDSKLDDNREIMIYYLDGSTRDKDVEKFFHNGLFDISLSEEEAPHMISYETLLKSKQKYTEIPVGNGSGYRDNSRWLYRMYIPVNSQNSAEMFYPVSNEAQQSLNVGGSDFFTSSPSPEDFPTYAGINTYKKGDFCYRKGRLYLCKEYHDSFKWNKKHFLPIGNRKVVIRSYWKVATFFNNYGGLMRGAFSLSARHMHSSRAGGERARVSIRI